jgi:hypothetical protein
MTAEAAETRTRWQSPLLLWKPKSDCGIRVRTREVADGQYRVTSSPPP